jgi:hypothetical protein
MSNVAGERIAVNGRRLILMGLANYRKLRRLSLVLTDAG